MNGDIIDYVNYKEEFIYPSKDRLTRPMPGDPIDWGEAYGQYPFPVLKPGPEPTKVYGRISDYTYVAPPSDIHCCANLGSAFLGLITEKDGEKRIYCSVSGGPFIGVRKVDLVYSGENRYVPFWNWKKGGARAGNGYHFNLIRPIWLYKPYPKKD